MPQPAPDPNRLKTIAQLVAAGYGDREIAEMLGNLSKQRVWAIRTEQLRMPAGRGHASRKRPGLTQPEQAE